MVVDRRPVLVTGAHRSGTTWVGKMLTAGGQLAYISEPLNVHHRPGVMRVPVERWYTYLTNENEARYLTAFQETLAVNYHWGLELASLRSLKDALRMARDGFRFARGRLSRVPALLKDPFAVFSARWFAERLDCRVVFVVRHPAAFASSLKRYGWTFNFEHLLRQPLLMRDWLDPFHEDMRDVQQDQDNAIASAALLWRLVYHVVGRLCDQRPEFILARHEDLSLNPVAGYQDLYDALGLEFTPKAELAVSRASSADNRGEISVASKYSVNLDSRANLANWRKRLTTDEIAYIREATADVTARYYSDEDWLA
jgi:hypothetical protein